MSTNRYISVVVSFIICGVFVGRAKAQEPEDSSILGEGSRLSVVRDNGVPAWKFVSRTASVALVHFRKHGEQDAFAVHVTDWDTFHIRTGWLYFSRTRLSFESDDDKQRNFDAPLPEIKKVKGQKNYTGWNYLVVKVNGKEKRFMINFDPVPQSRTGPWGAHQKPVFDLLERLIRNYEEVERDFQERLSKLAQPDAGTIDSSSQASSTAPNTAANIEITSEPSGAEIYVDGAFNSSTPSKLSLSIGEHSIRVTRPGFKDWERRIIVDGKSTKAFNAILEKKYVP